MYSSQSSFPYLGVTVLALLGQDSYAILHLVLCQGEMVMLGVGTGSLGRGVL